MAMFRWERDSRYYAASLEKDLLGNTVLLTCWGSRDGKHEGVREKVLGSREEGLAALQVVTRRRVRQQFRLVRAVCATPPMRAPAASRFGRRAGDLL